MNTPSLFPSEVPLNAAPDFIEKRLQNSKEFTVGFGMFKNKRGQLSYNGLVTVIKSDGSAASAVVVSKSFEGMVMELVEKVKAIKP
jgi:hypothetical protein